MIFISSLGYPVPFEVWQEALLSFQFCQHDCAATRHACSQGCVEAFPVPPLGNVALGLACVEGCAAEGQACLDLCQLGFFLELGFNGVPDDHKNPAGTLNNKVKPTFKNHRRTLLKVGGYFALAGGAVAVIGDFFGNKNVKFLGGLVALYGGAAIACERLIKRSEEDPPDAAFTEIFRPRRLRLQELLPGFLLHSEAALIFLRLMSEILLTVSYLEGIAVSLERASAAHAANDINIHFAQLRVSQRYAQACAGSIRRMQTERSTVADRLKDFVVDVNEEPIPRILLTALLRDFSVAGIRPRERKLVITHAEVIAVQDKWRREGIDEFIREFLEGITGSQSEAAGIIADVLNAQLAEEDFGKSISALLQNAELIQAENELVKVLEEWASFYVES